MKSYKGLNLFGQEIKPEKGKVRDFATGRLVKATREEKRRQEIETRLIDEYGYSSKQMDIEVLIRSGTKELPKRADVVVFRDEQSKDPHRNAYIIVEVKREDRKDGLDQLMTYINNTTAQFGVWYNGREILFLHRLRKPHKFVGIPDIPKKGETIEDVGRYYKKDLVPARNLKSVFEVIHNYIYANEGFLKERVFTEMLRVIFMKMVDEKSSDPRCEFRITERELEEIEEGRASVFVARTGKLFGRVKKEYRAIFDPMEKISLKPLTLAFAVSRLQKYNLLKTPADAKGVAFQTFVHAKLRGERGEFFTPYPIIELAVKMLDPKDDEAVLDPACGSGTFLIEAMKHVWDKIDRYRSDLDEVARKDIKIRYARTYIRGIDINSDLAKVAKMHMILYDDGHTGIFAANSLDTFNEIRKMALEAGAGEIGQDIFNIVLTNPPFGTKGRVTDKRILEQFDLAHKWKYNRKSKEWNETGELQRGTSPEILFIERCIQFLGNTGRMATVVPDGILTNISLGWIRRWIQDHARILAVVSLPQETFIPFGAGTKTSVLFLQTLDGESLQKLKKQNYPIFMAVSEKIGYDVRGKTLYKKNEKGEILRDENSEPIVDTDIPKIIRKFNEFKRKHKLDF